MFLQKKKSPEKKEMPDRSLIRGKYGADFSRERW
jgi:hypothetical protein